MKLSENALEVLNKRYLMRDKDGNITETPEEMFRRVAHHVAKAEPDGPDGFAWREKFYEVMSNLEFLPNSPCLRNAGISKGSLSACFVLPIEDSRRSIFKTLNDAVEVQAFGGGTGYSFSNLRPQGSHIATTKGRASGPCSFMEIFDFVIGEIIEQGGVRKGAQLGTLRCDHPDIFKFIDCKKQENKLNHFNISVSITNNFMAKIDSNGIGNWNLSFGGESTLTSAKEIWDKIIRGAWENGEPGILFIDTINKLNPVSNYQTIESCNPCGESPLAAYESCNLGSINLSRFVKTLDLSDSTAVKSDLKINWTRLKEVVKIAVRFLDNVIDVNNYSIPEIEIETKKFRKIGLGVMGWADMLIKLDISYNSPEALELAEKVMKFINDNATEYSEELLQEKGYGTWEGFLDPVIYAHDRNNPLFHRRNATLSIIAPTGTLSLIAGCSSGIEPVFSFEFKKKCLGGEIIVKHPLYEQWEKDVNYQLPYDKPRYFVESKEVPIEQHIKMQAAFQRHTHGGVSKTVNAPNSSTIEDVDRAFKLAWKLGVKGITFYRDGSREFQAQTAVIESKPKPAYEIEVNKNAEANLKILEEAGIKADTNNVQEEIENTKKLSMPEAKALAENILIKAECERTENHVTDTIKYLVTGVPDNNPEGTLEPPEWMLGGRQMIKTGEGTLWVHLFEDPKTGYKEVWAQISKEGRTISSMNAGLGRLATLALNRGATWDEVVKQLRGIVGERTAWFNGEQVMSPPDGIAKVIKKRVLDSKEWPVSVLLRCLITGNPCGTDTWMKGKECQCDNCRIYMSQHSSMGEQGFCKSEVGGSSPSVDPIDITSENPFKVYKEEMENKSNLCPDCASQLIYDEGCKGGRCLNCGFSSCS